jgi:hypothetical protein
MIDTWKSVIAMLAAPRPAPIVVICPACGGACEQYELDILGRCDACFSSPPAPPPSDFCPACGGEGYMETRQTWDGDWYVTPCPACHAYLDDYDRDWAYDHGRRHLGI